MIRAKLYYGIAERAAKGYTRDMHHIRIRELCQQAKFEPKDWPCDERTFKALRPKSHTPWREKFCDILVARLGEDYREELTFLFFLDETYGPKRWR
jgi:hypothetical protein